jgi:predicted amidophosphoribosyltransferase
MAETFTLDEPRQTCPTCRASYPYGVARCAFCGSPLPYPPALPVSDPLESPAPAAPELPPPEPLAAAPASPTACQWCGAPRAEGTERCPTCGATYAVASNDAESALAALELQLQAAKVNASVHEQGERTARRWRWASWALARAILRWPGNL